MSAAKRAKMRARISQIAGDLFKANGFGTVSMRRIAKDIGCTPMALYSYYDSKLDILRSLWSEVFQDLFEGLERIPQSTSAREYLASLAAAYVDPMSACFWIIPTSSQNTRSLAKQFSAPAHQRLR